MGRSAHHHVLGLVWFLALPPAGGALAAVAASSTSGGTSPLAGLPTHRVPLRRASLDGDACWDSDVEPSPYALAVTVAPSSLDVTEASPSPPSYNFLATQVWPSARAAAAALEAHLLRPPANAASPTAKPASAWWGGSEEASQIRPLCELGCGPGLPSLAAAAAAARAAAQSASSARRDSSAVPTHFPPLEKVVATDVDPVALELVRTAAREQGLLGSVLTTRQFDLVRDTREDGAEGVAKNEVPIADLYVLSDVFESADVARGAARLTLEVLRRRTRDEPPGPGPFVWVFAQSDRAQRDIYLEEVKRGLGDGGSLTWTPLEMGPPPPSSASQSRLWLCDVDETRVKY